MAQRRACGAISAVLCKPSKNVTELHYLIRKLHALSYENVLYTKTEKDKILLVWVQEGAELEGRFKAMGLFTLSLTLKKPVAEWTGKWNDEWSTPSGFFWSIEKAFIVRRHVREEIVPAHEAGEGEYFRCLKRTTKVWLLSSWCRCEPGTEFSELPGHFFVERILGTETKSWKG